MCGIAGVIGRSPADARPALERMQAALRHRGPDGEGMWWSPSGAAALAHTRLAVIDIGDGGRQPMTTPDGRITVSFSGEIYNFAELRRQFEQKGATFRTQSDTEVILRGYELFGLEVLPRLRGMFAIALWDERERTCTLARDPFGLKPMYYHRGADGSLLFASEVRALLASKLAPRELDGHGLYGYLRTGTVPEPHTLVKNVCAVGAGYSVTWDAGALTSRRLWSPHFPRVNSQTNHHAESVRAALIDSVEHHFVGDVPVGILLSGGMDSAALLALAAQGGRTGVRTISMSLPGSAADEGTLARQTADRFGASHIECAVDARGAREMFPTYLDAIDQPTIDGFNTFVVARFARAQGLKVVLSGLGADEMFGGYGSFTRVPRMTAWNEQLAWAGPIRRAGGRMLEQWATGPRWRRVGDLLQQPPTVANTYATFRAIFTRRESRRIAAALGVEVATGDVNDEAPSSPTVGDEVSRLELTHYVRNQLVRDSDNASMACGVELRAPYLDATLFETLAKVPSEVRLASSKRLLRDAVGELPPWVVGPKRCFQFPFEDWAANEWRPVFAGIDARSPVPTETWYRKVCLHVLDHWMARMKLDGR
jgi:asparagine synthase (glutamine-hydrolysing)